jgi:DNA-binding LacI/PurR family transcriptional regulator
LPTVRELADRLSVSQYAIQSSFTALREEGLVNTHVGRGTFVAGPQREAAPTIPRTVLTLLHRNEYERGDIIGQLLHQKLIQRGHRSVTLTYADVEDVIPMLKDGPRYDACILQPRASLLPVEILGLLRARSDNVLIEMRIVDLLDVDAISNDPAAVTELILGHLTKLGHRRIAWIMEEHDDFFYELTVPLFRAYRQWNGLSDVECPVVRLPTPAAGFGYGDLAAGLAPLLSSRLPPTALALLTFDTASRIIAAFEKLGLSIPGDVSVVRMGSPDLKTDHGDRITTVGRPTEQAADAVIGRLEWRWANPTASFGTYFDTPRLVSFGSTGPIPV